MRPVLRVEQSVAVEVAAARERFRPVAVVGIERAALCILPAERLVGPVPHKSALEFRILSHQLPIACEFPLRVAHGVGIFTHDERPQLRGVAAVAFAPVEARIHRAVNVRLARFVRLLILHRPARVGQFDPVVGRLEVRPVARLVAQAPHNHRRVVAVACHVALVALQMRQRIVRVLGQRVLAVAHAVALDVSFRHEVESIAVAQVIPVRVVRVVARAHRIDVQFLHPLHVALHVGAAHHISAVRFHFVPVHALDQHRLPVHKQLRMLDLHAAKSHILPHHLRHASPFVAHRGQQRV